MSKMGSHDPFEYSKHVMAKRKAKSQNVNFDSYQLKVRNYPVTSAFRWHATYPWKFLNKGYNFA